jgi:hypothetical protein
MLTGIIGIFNRHTYDASLFFLGRRTGETLVGISGILRFCANVECHGQSSGDDLKGGARKEPENRLVKVAATSLPGPFWYAASVDELVG